MKPLALRARAARAAVAAWLAVLWLATAHADTAPGTPFLERMVRIDEQDFPYQVYVPPRSAPGVKLPVILALHGVGQAGTDGKRQLQDGLAPVIRRHPERFAAIVVFPQARVDGSPLWQANAGRAAMVALERSIGEFSGDPARVYLTGYSVGGNGAWYLAAQHADRFAALVVVCGFVSAYRGATGTIYPPLVDSRQADPYLALARRLAGIPVWIFHGDADPVISVEESRRMAKALQDAGADVRYSELPGVGHDAWTPAYEQAELVSWLLRQRRVDAGQASRSK
jgi:predicted peptidase